MQLSEPLRNKPNHLCCVGQVVTVILIPPEVKVEPSLMPTGEDFHADVKVALARRIESNCMNLSPVIRGFAEREL